MAFTYHFPPMREEVLPNSLRFIMLFDNEQPVIELLFQVAGGHAYDPCGREGTAELTANLMLKGPRGCTHEQYADAMERVGASHVLDVGDEYTTFGVRTLKNHADGVMRRFCDTLLSPAFDEKEFVRVRREMVTALEAEYADPSALAGKHFQAELYGSSHPLGRIAGPKSVRRISIADVRAMYGRLMSASNAAVVIAGDETVDTLEKKWKNLFDALQKSCGDMPDGGQNATAAVKTTRIRLVDKPDTSQTTLIVGHFSVAERHPAREALALGNYILGGGNFSSRLMNRVRSRTGKTYGISSQIASRRDTGAFMMSTTTQNHQVGDVLAAIIDVYRDTTENGISEEELEKAKQFASGNLAFQLEGIGNVAEKLLWLRFYGYDNSYIENHAAIISSIGIDAVNEALKNVLASEGFVIAAVGRRADIERQLERFGDVRVVNFRSDP